MKSKILIPILIAVFSASIFYLYRGGSNTNLTIGSAKNLWNTLIHIADEKGFFLENDINADIKYLGAGKYSMDAVISQSADIGAVVEVNLAYLGLSEKLPSVELIGTIVTSTGSKIIADKSSGINKPSDLKGKSLSLSPGTTSEIFAHRFLEKHQISIDDITVKKVQPNGIQFSLGKSGSNAISTWEPFAYNASKSLGNDAIQFTAPDVYKGYMNLAVNPSWASSNKNKLINFLKALKQAERFIKSNEEESQRIMSKRINLDLSTVQAVWPYYNMKLEFQPNILQRDTESIGSWLIETQANYSEIVLPDYSEYLNDSYISTIE